MIWNFHLFCRFEDFCIVFHISCRRKDALELNLNNWNFNMWTSFPKPIQPNPNRAEPNRTSKYRNKILNFKTAGLRSSNFEYGSSGSWLILALAFLLPLKIVLDWDLFSFKKRTLKFNLLSVFSNAEINEFDKKI